MNQVEEKPALVQITTRVTQEELDLIQTVANNERRSLSNLLAIIVSEYCNNKLSS